MLNFLKNKPLFYLILIISFALFLRLYGLNWDQSHKLHPDERMIVITALRITLPKTDQDLQNLFTKDSTLNPKFFAYGNFPIYLLKASGALAGYIDSRFSEYTWINLLGRIWSAFFDIGIIIALFFLGGKLFNKTVGLLSSLFYTVSVLPIQLSHFYAVDTTLTFFILITLYQLIRFYEKPTRLRSVLVGIFFGLSLATKTSGIILICSIGTALIVDFLLIFIKNPHRFHIWFPHLPVFFKRLLIDGLIIIVVTCITFVIFEPFALIDSSTFLKQTQEQRKMTFDAFTFPYTLQYVGKIPYFYEIKNIFFWGQGPILATFSFIGIFYFTFIAFKKHKQPVWAKELIVAVYFWVYFLVVGNFAIGFMRYMLPVYPLLSLFGAILVYKLFLNLKSYLLNHKFLSLILNSIFLILIFIWPLSFINIYSKPNTRVMATEWINKNIPPGSSIATEHWDDGLPLGIQGNFKVFELPLYDQDTPYKWQKINHVLQQTEYIILASNRLYIPLQKLTDCQKLPAGRCYKQTSQYYKKLFTGSLGFKKVAEFSISPKIPFINIEIDDSLADESFTVYDHPKVIIFKKNFKQNI